MKIKYLVRTQIDFCYTFLVLSQSLRKFESFYFGFELVTSTESYIHEIHID